MPTQASHDCPVSLESLGDERLFARVQSGDDEAFPELVRRYQRALHRGAFSRLGRDDWAEEAVQETFLAAYRSAHTFNPRYALRTWLWTILLNQCRRLGKKHDRAVPTTPIGDGGESGLEPQWAGPTPLGSAITAERCRLLERLMRRLPENEADALRLRFFGQMTFPEIADTMQCSLLTAKNRVRRGLMRLAEMQSIRQLSYEDGANPRRQLVRPDGSGVKP